MNVKADETVDIYMGTVNHVNKSLLITPTKLQIIIRRKHITRNIKHKIRFNYADKELQNQIIRNNNWIIDTFYQVNWKLHGFAHNKHTNKRFNKNSVTEYYQQHISNSNTKEHV